MALPLDECRLADVLLTIGTSGLVYPAAGLPEMARRAGKKVIVINPNPTEQDSSASICLRGKAGVLLPKLLALIKH